MTANTIMSTDLVVVNPNVTVAEALLVMSEHEIHNLPVVDGDGGFVGLFSLRRFTHELLPTAARIDAESFRMDIGFLTDQSDEYLDRLRELGTRPVSDLLEKKKKLRFCEPDTPIPKLLQLLSENPTSLPVVVVEGESKRVVGMVSNWDVLNKVAVGLLTDASQSAGNDSSGSAKAGED